MTADRPRRPGWMSRLVHFPVTHIVLYLGGIAVALWILRLTARGLAAGLGAWWPAGVANVVLPTKPSQPPARPSSAAYG